MAKAKKLNSGNWRVRVLDYIDNDKKKHYKSFTAPTKKEAEFLAADYKMNSKTKTYAALSLSEAYDRYIESKSNVLSASTIADYKKHKRNDFKAIMQVRLDKLTPEIVQTAVNEMSARLSPKSVRNAHGLLNSVIKAYYPNLVLRTRLPQKKKKVIHIPTATEVKKLIDVADDRARVPILLASSGGLRRSEISALTVEDITDTGVSVNKAVVENEHHKWVVKQPKTNAGYRFVPLPQEVIKELRNWKHLGCSPAVISKHWDKALEKANIRHTTFHKLRHYFASECHAKGIPDQYIASVGGWESVDMLHKVYQHALEDEQKAFNSKIVTIFTQNLNKDDTKDDTTQKQA